MMVAKPTSSPADIRKCKKIINLPRLIDFLSKIMTVFAAVLTPSMRVEVQKRTGSFCWSNSRINPRSYRSWYPPMSKPKPESTACDTEIIFPPIIGLQPTGKLPSNCSGQKTFYPLMLNSKHNFAPYPRRLTRNTNARANLFSVPAGFLQQDVRAYSSTSLQVQRVNCD